MVMKRPQHPQCALLAMDHCHHHWGLWPMSKNYVKAGGAKQDLVLLVVGGYWWFLSVQNMIGGMAHSKSASQNKTTGKLMRAASDPDDPLGPR